MYLELKKKKNKIKKLTYEKRDSLRDRLKTLQVLQNFRSKNKNSNI